MVMASAAFVGSGCVLLSKGGLSTYVGYAAIAVFGAGGIIGALQLVPGASWLKATSEGLVVRSLWRGGTIRWSDVERFGVVEVPVWLGRPRKFVGYNYRPGRAPNCATACMPSVSGR